MSEDLVRTCIDDPVGSSIVEILHHVEGRDVEQWLEPQHILLFAIVHLSLNSISPLLAQLFVYFLTSFNIVIVYC